MAENHQNSGGRMGEEQPRRGAWLERERRGREEEALKLYLVQNEVKHLDEI